MDFLNIFLIAFSLSMDSFAVSVSSGLVLPSIRFNKALIIAFSLAAFQGIMPLIGWSLGLSLMDYVKPVDHWVAFVLLVLLGIKMISESFKEQEKKNGYNPLDPGVLVTLSVATSIDALIVGMSLAFVTTIDSNPWLTLIYSVLIVSGVTFLMSMLGILCGKKVGLKFGQKMEILGGAIIILIGVRILAEHLFI